MTDPIFFEHSLKFEIEHKGNTFYDDLSLAEAYSDRRKDFYSSVAFWYQTGEAVAFDKLPHVSERMYPCELIQVDELLDGKLPSNSTIHEDIFYTNEKGVQFQPGTIGESLVIPFEREESGNYIILLRLWPRGDAGIYDFYLDDQLLLKDKDLYREHHFVKDIKLGTMHVLEK